MVAFCVSQIQTCITFGMTPVLSDLSISFRSKDVDSQIFIEFLIQVSFNLLSNFPTITDTSLNFPYIFLIILLEFFVNISQKALIYPSKFLQQPQFISLIFSCFHQVYSQFLSYISKIFHSFLSNLTFNEPFLSFCYIPLDSKLHLKCPLFSSNFQIPKLPHKILHNPSSKFLLQHLGIPIFLSPYQSHYLRYIFTKR